MSAQSLRIAFYAPLKSPDHPVPSGDRQMARMLIACLEGAGHRVEVISHLRAYLPSSDDAQHWAALQAEAAAERDRIREGWRGGKPDLIFCYHNYYKSPDLIGHPLARDFAIPYMTCEASYSDRRNIGIWTEAQDMAREGARDAALNLSFTARDKEGLHDAVPEARVARFPPFIDTRPFHAEPQPEPGHIVTVAMMRPGDKLDSYRHLAEALRHLPSDLDWYLSIAGDGPARGEVEALFAALPAARLNWLGALPPAGVAALLSRGSLLLWPGCGEAYGLAYLEAQAAGLPVVAYRVAGVPEVVSDEAGGTLVAAGDTEALAEALARLLADPAGTAKLGAKARTMVKTRHSFPAASARLGDLVAGVMETGT
ncbi:MAG TPA: glycosyltransferase family 4 protein [Albidovulum sp.]|uniref:glycosyltransferase family 4 protein n=1 Tax=Albidovulum sp. TaxID=1872424 RepID=UPI002C59C00B|nr:glycosyltransferase family 4 protein [Albidovulum sp.]